MTELITMIDELDDVCQKEEIIIIYGAGVVGKLLVQYMLNSEYNDKLFCVAVKSEGNNPNNILGVPVCELRDLKDYKKNALFIVGTYEKLQKTILEDLENFGCAKVKRMSNLLCAKLRRNKTDFSVEIYSTVQQIERLLCVETYEKLMEIYKKLMEIENQIDIMKEVNEVCAVNSETFHGYENRFRDKDIVIMGAGPTLNYYMPIEDAIHIGVNTVYRYDKVKLDYLFVQDASRELDYRKKFNGLDKLNCHIFMGRYLHASPIKDMEFPEDYRTNQNIYNFYLDLYPSKHIYKDICFHPVMDFGSVVFSAIHFALYTQPRRIYLVGCDTSDKGYFTESNHIAQRVSKTDRRKRWIPGYLRVKEYAKIHYPQIEIISINPVGLKGIFRDIYTDNYSEEQDMRNKNE